jgi:phenylacetate-CoA ligase
MRTSLGREQEAQRLWKPVGRGMAPRVFAQLVAGEFRDPAEAAAVADAQLRSTIAHAAATVPYYARLFRRLGLAPADIAVAADLPRLPVMGKTELRRNRESLRSRQLPKGERIQGWFASSGTTGQPTRVLQTVGSNRMFTYLVQRQFRWFRFDPAGTFAIVRPPHSLPPRRDGKPHGADATGRLRHWRYVGAFFRTGPLVYASANLPGERLLAWLAEVRPDYLQSYSETLEQLALACDGCWPVDSLRGAQAIAQQLTPAMRARVETTMGVPVAQAYGLNEIGMVAARCAAGRYHVHAEHCIVEIVDDDGRPAPAGTTGRVVVTGLKNPAMPLIRYDTGDLAEAVDGPCPCGRTLPSFGAIQGRYSRIAQLPEGTAPLVRTFREKVSHLPVAALAGLRQFQLHQSRDTSFELRLVTAGEPPAGLLAVLAETWQAAGGARFPFRIVRVESIPLPSGGKFQDFTSDFMAAADTARTPEGR